MSERLHFSVARNRDHTTTVRTTQVDGEWWAQTSVDGVVMSYENIGPVDEVHPPVPRTTHERRPPRKAPPS